MQDTPRTHVGRSQATCRTHPGHTQDAHRTHAGHTQATHRPHSGRSQDTHRTHASRVPASAGPQARPPVCLSRKNRCWDETTVTLALSSHCENPYNDFRQMAPTGADDILSCGCTGGTNPSCCRPLIRWAQIESLVYAGLGTLNPRRRSKRQSPGDASWVPGGVRTRVRLRLAMHREEKAPTRSEKPRIPVNTFKLTFVNSLSR